MKKRTHHRHNKKHPKYIYFGYLFLLFIILIMIIGTATYIKEQYQQSDPKLFEIKEKLKLLSSETNRLKLYEDDKSYTINKKKIYLCLKDDKNKYYPINMLMYVSIHELAHVLCDEVGHTKKFQQIFSDLLEKATKLGIYDPKIPVIQNYCGYNKETFVLELFPSDDKSYVVTK